MGTKEEFVIQNGILVKYTGSAKVVAVPDGVVEIGAYAFMGRGSNNGETEAYNPNTALQEIMIPEGVVRVGNFAFLDCFKLAKVSLPSSLKEIGTAAFAACCSLTEIVLPEGLEIIRGMAFGNTELKSIAVPASVKLIETGAFSEVEIDNVKIGGTPIIQDCAFKGDHEKYKNGMYNHISWLKDSEAIYPLLFNWKDEKDPILRNGFEGGKLSLFRAVLNDPDRFRESDEQYLIKHAMKNKKVVEAAFASITVRELKTFISLGLVTAENTDLLLNYLKDKPEETSMLLKYISETITPATRMQAEEQRSEKIVQKNIKRNKQIEETIKLSEGKKPADIKKEWQVIENADGSLCIEKYKGKDDRIVIPAEIAKKSVSEIADDAMRAAASENGTKNAYQKKMYRNKTIVISEGIKHIGARAFKGCVYLTDVVISGTVSSIGEDAFLDCHKVKIHAPGGSFAEEYATQHHISFETE